MNIADSFTVLMTLLGLFFFISGTIGILRFPDVFSRLHALTKADNLGLGFIVFGLIPQLGLSVDALQIFITWVFVMIAGAACSYFVANYRLERLSMEETSHSEMDNET